MEVYKILYLEDSPLDAELIKQRFKREADHLEVTHVTCKEDLLKELATESYALLLCDYSLPGYDPISALEAAKKHGLPTIIISGAIGEEAAVELIQKGAVDYLSKDRAARLTRAIEHAIDEDQKAKNHREMQQLYQTLVESSRALIFKMDPIGHLLYLNENLLTLVGEKAKKGSWLDLFAAGDRSELKQAISRKKPFEQECHLLSSEGENRWVNGYFKPVVNSSTEIEAWIVTLIDITHLSKAEQESRFKSLFLAQMSHEFLTPLNSILGFTELLKEEMVESSGNPKWINDLDKVKEAGETLLGFITNILTLSDLKIDIDSEEIELLSLREFCEELKKKWEKSEQLNQRTLTLHLGTPLPKFFNIKRKHLEILFENLLSNAFKFSPKKKEIELHVSQKKDRVVFCLSNESGPLSNEEQNRVFRLFEKGDIAQNSQIPGLGLGLVIAKQIVEALGGELTLESHDALISVCVRLPLNNFKTSD